MKSSQFDWQIPPGTCILLVDDSLDNLDILMDYIEQSQWPLTVLRAQSAPKALEILRRRSVQLIVSDWDMPEMNGLEFLRQLQADAKLSRIPVVMCTGVMTTAGHLETALLKGAVDYLRKPVDAVEFLARIRSSLELADTQQRLQALNQSKDEIFIKLTEALASTVGMTHMALEMAEEQWDQPECRTYFNHALTKSEQGRHILGQLIGWSRYRFAQWPIAREAVSLRPIFEQLRQRYEKHFSRQELSIRLRCNNRLQVIAETDLLTELVSGLLNLLCGRGFGETIVLRAVPQQNYIRIDIATENQSSETIPSSPLSPEIGLQVCQELAHLLGTRIQSLSGPESGYCLLLPVLPDNILATGDA